MLDGLGFGISSETLLASLHMLHYQFWHMLHAAAYLETQHKSHTFGSSTQSESI